MATRTWLEQLPVAECRRRLATSVLGRISVFVEGRPEIFPVNHVYESSTGAIVFPTNAGTKAWAALHWPWVGFEIDGIEPGAGPDGPTGWSVLVVGRAEEVTDPEEIRWAASMRPVLWAVGPSTHWLRIVPARITGRSIRLVTVPEEAAAR
jgi:nitroimidazol reductase NimA-like FMN-containing flavoprotein (pyridoxamine 5'-phosphate oxidase superfamily)